jgi:Iron-containing redox enzyme
VAGDVGTFLRHENRATEQEERQVLTPKPRGTLSQTLFELMRSRPDELATTRGLRAEHADDASISLWTLYELSYRGFEDVAESLEWHPDLVALRGELEVDLENALRERFRTAVGEAPAWSPEGFFDFCAEHDGPSLAAFVHRDADAEQVLDLLRLRSIYHLKEADPVAWLVPRLDDTTKAALMELQYDEYGTGNPHLLHAGLFARGLEACGLSPAYGAYIDDAPVEILEQNNAMTLFGLNRRLRGAALGHLAAFEATSSLPSRRIAQGLRRVGLPDAIAAYYDEHVEADAVHEQLAVRTILGSLLAAEPTLGSDVFLGAFSCLDLEDRVAHRMLGEWAA